MSERETIRRIREELAPEFLAQFIDHNKEYPEERPLGERMEWAEIHRKVMKLKAPIWDGQEWKGREPLRQMVLEIIGHAYLLLIDLDAAELKQRLREEGEKFPKSVSVEFPPGAVSPENLSAVFGVDGGPGRMPSLLRGYGISLRDMGLASGDGTQQPATEEEAYTAQRTARFKRQQVTAQQAKLREEAAWRVRHCGIACAPGHTGWGECQNTDG